MPRLFFAITLPDGVERAVADVQTHLREAIGDVGVRWVAPAQFHVTLKFLGDTPEADLPDALEAARRAAADIAPFTLTLGGVGVFPQQRRPQVLWIGAGEEFPHLMQMVQCLDTALAERGFAAETRPFRPHLTLARMQTPDGQEAVAKTLETTATELKNVDRIGVIEVQSFVLMRSDLRPSGPTYTVLAQFPLIGLSSSL